MQYVNLTAHVLNIHRADGSVMDVPTSGLEARVDSDHEVVRVDENGVERLLPSYGGVVLKTLGRDGQVVAQGLPAPRDGVELVVSGMVASAAPRADVSSPGPLVRNDQGQPVGCRGLLISLR